MDGAYLRYLLYEGSPTQPLRRAAENRRPFLWASGERGHIRGRFGSTFRAVDHRPPASVFLEWCIGVGDLLPVDAFHRGCVSPSPCPSS
jgi:hypothetical protein